MNCHKLLFFVFLSTPMLSFTVINDKSFFTLTSFEVEISEDNKTLTITNRYTSTVENNSYYCDLCWYVSRDGEEKYLDFIRFGNFKKVTNALINKKPKVDIASLGEDNELVLYIIPCDTKVTTRESLHLNLKGKTSVTFSEKDNDIGVSSGYIVESRSTYDETKNFVKEDRIIFTNYEDLVVEDYYLNFDIRRFNYIYKGNDNLLDGNFYFLIYDKYNLFKDLPIYNESQYRYIELKPNVLNEDSNFSFKNNLYYDPVTHNPSISYKEGYVSTEKLYFPIGQLNVLKSIHCALSFDIKGYTNFNMNSSFDIYFIKNYFGDCSDSEYCIEMHDDEGVNVREKVIEVNI